MRRGALIVTHRIPIVIAMDQVLVKERVWFVRMLRLETAKGVLQLPDAPAEACNTTVEVLGSC